MRLTDETHKGDKESLSGQKRVPAMDGRHFNLLKCEEFGNRSFQIPGPAGDKESLAGQELGNLLFYSEVPAA